MVVSTVDSSIPSTIDANWIGWNKLNKITFSLSITGFTAAGSLITHPLYVLTTRQQVGSKITGDLPIHNNPLKGGIFSGLYQAYRKVGLSGLYRGWPILASSTIPSNIVYFSVMESSREFFRTKFEKQYPNTPTLYVDGFQSIFSGFSANFSSLLIYNPAEVMVARMAVQNIDNRSSTRAMIKGIWKEEKVFGFYRGFNMSFVSGAMASSIWWFSYTVMRRISSQVINVREDPELVDLVSGFSAGLCATSFAHPVDSMRAKIMTGTIVHRSFILIIKDLLRKNKLHTLWRGLLPSLIETSISSALFALSYEFIKRISEEVAK